LYSKKVKSGEKSIVEEVSLAESIHETTRELEKIKKLIVKYVDLMN
jgi:hypothetical protein